ncbi:MAG: ribonuclease H-like domain-containing protein [Spirochaetales bacterium]|uniref:Ribonuclease H-like domain-containing protein n=1 Tax=Candidatus Thalassospirochaeta sargassi TaxID=3119039 RepID=A0AAJ1IEJ8_9SPIO|nr:ribonuclease H-like domain-containing protein [Spirochaetales bacterium]
MDLKDLRGRLDAIKQQSAATPDEDSRTAKPEQSDAGEVLLENGWNKVEDMVYEKVSVIKNALPQNVSSILLNKIQSPDRKIPASDLIFYDTETTGLSAGAGNIIFLAGFGELVPGTDNFQITQIFLSDFPGEPAFLDRLKDFISPERIYVSYNGKSFDANVLNTRFSMNGIKAEFGYQLDLLYSSRRLWKNIIGSCSLGDIETRILDKHRELDVPGFMIPDLYFDFVRTGRWDTIAGVIAHHLEDIASLAELLTVHEQLFDEAAGGTPGPGNDTGAGTTDFFDQLGLASMLIEKRPEAAVEVLKQAWGAGNYRAGIELSLIFKRTDRWEQAIMIWEKLWADGRSIFAATELAKYYEHRAHKPETALEITEKMLAMERFRIAQHLPDLNKRYGRLKKRTSR